MHIEPAQLRAELATHHAAAFGFALSCCQWDHALAEDVLQVAYLKVLDGRASFAGRSSFRTFLFGVVRRTASEHRRSAWRRFAAWRRNAETAPPPPDARDDSSLRDAARLRRELQSLPARQREVLHLVFYGDLSIAEAAEVMGVALGTARAHYERGKHRLRERLGLLEAADGEETR